MNWKESLSELETAKKYKQSVELIQKVITEHSNSIDAYIRGVYLLHNILVEEDYPDEERPHLEDLLRQYFHISYQMFSSNSEYLFFIGKILYISEWYFGVNDDMKPISSRMAFQMQMKAYEMEKGNALYEWAYRLSLNDDMAGYLAKQILQYDTNAIGWLKSKGFPGKYILETLEQSQGKFIE